MKTIVIVVLSFLWSNLFSQSYIATWESKGYKSFQVQRSTDNKNWKVIKTVTDTSYIGTGATYYWRIKLGNTNTYSDTVWVYAMATATNAKLKTNTTTSVISWTSHTETNMNYYTIESLNKSTVVMKHGGNYTITVPRDNGKYNIIVHYKNGAQTTLKSF